MASAVRRKLPNYGAVVGQRVKALRRAAGLTQTELAEESGLSRATVAGLELGRYSSVELSTLGALAAALDVPEGNLLENADESNKVSLARFERSSWFAAIEPTPTEVAWLRAMPANIWDKHVALNPKFFADLVELRRRHERK